MCGILVYIGSQNDIKQVKLNKKALKTLEKRGPDSTSIVDLDRVWLGFTRLAINGLNKISNQPMRLGDLWLVCNGEIYNYKELGAEFGFNFYSNSDVEVILHLFNKLGFPGLLERLVGVFSIFLYDEKNNIAYIANDRIGIRPLFFAVKKTDVYFQYFFASEPITLHTCEVDNIEFFQPGTYSILNLNYRLNPMVNSKLQLPHSIRYYHYKWNINKSLTLPHIYDKMRELLTQSVKRRMLSDRPIATLLSGGLDSSLVAALVAKELGENKVHTFSIGLAGSPDLHYAKIVANHIKSVHHNIELTEDDFIKAIPEVIRAIQSWDITTIRASIGNYLLGKYIKKNTDFTVIFNGDVSEELNASYYYSRFAPNPKEFNEDNVRLMREVHQYDVLRSARCIESNGLEPRTPFADQDFVNFVMTIDPCLKMVGKQYQPIEKYLLRKAFEGTGLLPDKVLWRPKEAFSDGVSEKGRSLYKIIGEYVDKIITDDEFEMGKKKYSHCPPISKESYYYRKIFEEYLPNRASYITNYWMPRFVECKDPSARVLQN